MSRGDGGRAQISPEALKYWSFLFESYHSKIVSPILVSTLTLMKVFYAKSEWMLVSSIKLFDKLGEARLVFSR